MSTRELIEREFARAAESRRRALPPLCDDLTLSQSGLDSLSFAGIVARLEDALGFDPFTESIVPFPVTFGEFVRLYEGHQT